MNNVMNMFQGSIHRLCETITFRSVEGGAMLMGHPVQLSTTKVSAIILLFWSNNDGFKTISNTRNMFIISL